MNKKLLTTAVAAAVVGAPIMAQAEVTVYGAAQAELAQISQDDNTNVPGADPSGLSMVDNARGRVGVKGSEDLGNGLKGIFKFEWRLDTTDNRVRQATVYTYTTTTNGAVFTYSTNASTTGSGLYVDTVMSARESFVGLSGGFGTLMLGNLKTPYKYYGGVNYDAFVTTTLEARRNGGMSGGGFGHNGFLPKMIGYQKDIGPGQLWIDYGLDQAANSDSSAGSDGDYSIGFRMGDKMWEGFIALNKNKDNVDSAFAPGIVASDYDAAKIGGMYKMGDGKIMLQIEQTEQEDANSTDIMYLAYHHTMGKNMFVFQYGTGTQEDERPIPVLAEDIDTDYLALGVVHKFSAQTRVFGGYRASTRDNGIDATLGGIDDEETSISVGLRKDF